jgi:ABC-type multidrug transport system permease subunit
VIRLAWVVAEKEFLHMLHDRFTLVLTFGLPIFQLLLFGYALETNIRNVPAAVLDRDQRPESRALISQIRAIPLFHIVKTLDSDHDADVALRQGQVRAVIDIPKGFTSDLVYRGKTTVYVRVDGSDRAISNYLVMATSLLGLEQSLEHTVRQRLPLQSVTEIDVRPRLLFNSDSRTAAFLVPGLVAVLVQMITTLLLALSITKEREAGTLQQMLATKVGLAGVITGKLVAALCVGVAEALALLVVLRWIFDIRIHGSVMALAAAVPLLLLAPAGIGLLIAARARHQAHGLQLTYLIFLPSVLLSGFLFPREFMPQPAQWFSTLLPTTYTVDLMRGIILRGAVPLQAVAGALALGIFFLCAGFVRAYARLPRAWD